MVEILFPLEPIEKETMLSLTYRLAENNMLKPSTFVSSFLLPNLGEQNRNNIVPSLDGVSLFYGYFHAEPAVRDKVRFFLDHSIYGGYAPFISAGQQMQIINKAFRSPNQFKSFNSSQNGITQKLLYCPECRKHDMERYGHPVYYTVHQMPGITVCPYHHVPLVSHKYTSLKKLFEQDEQDTAVTVSPIDWENRYADFALSLLDAELDTNIAEIVDVIFERINMLGWTDNHYEGLKSHIKSENVVQLAGVNIDYFMKVQMIQRLYLDVSQCVAMLCLLFDNPSQINEHLQKQKDRSSIRSFLKIAIGKYNVFEPFKSNILEMECLETKEHFITTVFGFDAGWREPSADIDKSEEEKFAELFNNVTDGTYELQSSYDSMDSRLKILHKKCGNVITPRARSFLIDGSRCACENKLSFTDAAKAVAENEGYTLIAFNGTEKLCTIRHDECGTEVQCIYRNFIRHPNCPKCTAKQQYNIKEYSNTVQQLVGNEYAVIKIDGNAVGMAAIRHNTCGQISTYRANRFLMGQRCPFCHRLYTEDKFREAVTSLSNGRYSIGRRIYPDKSEYEIIDCETGESKILTSAFILQELRRPTPSQVLPLDSKGEDVIVTTSYDKVLQFLQNKYRPDDYIFLEDIHLADITYVNIKHAVSHLTQREILYKLAPGVYCFSDIKIDADKYINEKYLNRHGTHIGYLYGKSLAYSLGIIRNEPDMIYITTNAESQTHGRKKTVMNHKLRIQGSSVFITDENIPILEILDLLKTGFHFGYKVRPAINLLIAENNITKEDIKPYLPYFSENVQKAAAKLWR